MYAFHAGIRNGVEFRRQTENVIRSGGRQPGVDLEGRDRRIGFLTVRRAEIGVAKPETPGKQDPVSMPEFLQKPCPRKAERCEMRHSQKKFGTQGKSKKRLAPAFSQVRFTLHHVHLEQTSFIRHGTPTTVEDNEAALFRFGPEPCPGRPR